MKPDYLIQGDSARLIPVGSESNKEARVLSVSLAMMTQIPSLSKNLLASCNYRLGARAKLHAWTEVTLGSKDNKDRPDALLKIVNGKNTWTALIEAKIGKATLSEEQVARYIAIAKEHNIDAVITISNQMVARADHHPINIPKNQLRKVELFHWPWAWILSEAEILRAEDSVDDSEQAYMLDEFIRFLDHQSTGVEGFTQMNKGWKAVVKDAVSQIKLKRTDQDIEETVGAWLQEQRDLALLMSKHIGKNVHLKMDRKVKDDPVARLKHRIADFCDTNTLFTILQIPDAASDLLIQANLPTRSITASMKLKAPQDKKSTSARVNWLLRMLKNTDEDARIIVKASWPSVIDDTSCALAELREDPDKIQCSNPKHAPTAFEVVLLQDSAVRFSGSRTFIEDVEEVARTFYDLVGQNLRAWQPAPPKPISRPKAVEAEPEQELEEAILEE
ncbi:hypothetical protein ACMXYX_01100 [Neptuniibacter sp. QD72_48]|uniref:hypothetical protein n=1 Tax=Neptuniibacter sp. QD72_48 TaxID=3398214 RepID=UPI0039F59FFA